MNSPIFQGQLLSELAVRPVMRSEPARYRAQMAQHHYLGDLPKIGETLWDVATWRAQWVAQLSVSAAALKCGVRDRWIGWDFRVQYDRLTLIANNSRFLILPEGRWPNVGAKMLSLLARRVGADWQRQFGHRLLLLETFVDPCRFHGGVYRAVNWLELGVTRGYRRTREGYSSSPEAPKRMFVRPLCRDALARLTHHDRARLGLTGVAHPLRQRPRKHHAPAPLRRRRVEVVPETPPVDCANHAQARLPLSNGLRLPAHDHQLALVGRRGRVRTNLPWWGAWGVRPKSDARG